MAAVLSLTPGVALAGQNPGVAFEDNRELKLAPDSPESLRTATVCNVSDVEAQKPIPVISTFQKGTDAPVALMTAEITGDNGETWQAGECRDVVLSVADGVEVAAGSYSGLLTVRSSVGLARRSITLTGPSEVTKPTQAKSATDPATLSATRVTPWTSADLDDPAQLLLVAAAPGQTLTVPRDCPKSRPTVGTKPCPFIGNLVNGHQVAKVYVAGALVENQNQPAKLKLRVTRATGAGAYTGKVDLAQTPTDPADDIALTVNVKDAVWCAVIALLIGAGIAFGLQYATRTSWPKKRMRDRYRNFGVNYTSAVDEFNKHRPLQAEVKKWSPPTGAAIGDVKTDIESGIKLYRKSTVYWDASSEGYKELDSSIAQVEDDIDCLRDKLRLADGLTKLEAALKGLATFLTTKYHAPREPAFVLPATALLKGPKPEEGKDAPGPLAVGQALTLHKSAKAATALVAAWTELAEDALEYDAWWDRLAKKSKADKNWSEEDKETLKDAAAHLAVARHELLAVEDADGLAELHTKRDLHRVYEKLAYLSGAHGGAWPAGDDVDAGARSLAMRDMDIAGAVDFGYSNVTHALGTWLEDAAEWASDPATAAKLRTVGGVLVASLIIGFTVLMAIATGLATFYFGKDTWGTPDDYFTVIVIGAAAQVLVQGVVDVVNKLLPPAPKQLITGPSAAVLKPPAATTT
ncbi:MAG TPA: hypothetical protein VFN44_22480 [Solirubrobacteraceae bacterium]|nr:hypothetical protein [Solirubrobacteraceae bacterium]